MLNELSALSHSLTARGIQTQAWHPWIQTFKKGEAIVAELNESGDLARVSLLSGDEVAGLRNIAPDFHNSFPGLNLNCPVLIVPNDGLWNDPDELWKAAVATILESPLAYGPKDLRRLGRLLGDFPLKEIAPRLWGDGPKLRATIAVLERLALKKPEAESFLHDLSLQIVAAAQDGRLTQATALAILYGKPNKKKLRLEEWKTTLIFEVSDFGRFPYRVSGNVLLRSEQYRWADRADRSAQVARSVVIAKVANSRTVLQRALRDKTDGFGTKELEQAVRRLGRLLDDVAKAGEVDAIRGHEGDAARVYFGVFEHLIAASKEEFFFRWRNRRPRLDNVNALLSFSYTLLTHDITAALETVGLDPAVGYLHRDRPGRPSLWLDLLEELRPVIADRLVLSMINRRQVHPEGFRKTESGGVVMDDATRKELLVAYQNRKQDEIQHPFLGEKVAFGLVPHLQATLLAWSIRGDLDGYPSFLWK